MKRINLLLCALVAVAATLRADESVNMDDRKLIASIYERCLDVEDKATLAPLERMVYRVHSYSLELGSGEDFLQWFRWTKPEEARTMPATFTMLGITNSATICAAAIKVAFPSGIPSAVDEYESRVGNIGLEKSLESGAKGQGSSFDSAEKPSLFTTTFCLRCRDC